MTFPALLASEIGRLLSRRVVRWGVLIGLGIIAIIVGVVVSRSGNGDANDMRLVSLWFDHPNRSGIRDDDVVLQMAVYIFIFVIGIAATGVGGEYRAGTVGTLLTWEPRRVRVAIARLAAVKIVAVLVFLVLIGFLIGGWWLGAATRGSTTQLGPSFWVDLVALVGRGAVVVAVLAVITASLVFITRNTVGAVIIWFGYLVAIEGILASRFPGLRPALLVENLAAFLAGKDVKTEPAGFSSEVLIAHPGPALIRLLVIALILAAGAIVAFRRRDVT